MSYKIRYEDFVRTYSKTYHSAKYYPKVLQKFKQGWDVRKISKYFRIPYQTVWKWVKKKSVPVPFVEYTKIKKEFSKKGINDLAPVLGHIFGDGGILNNGKIHYCNSEKFLIEEFITAVGNISKCKPLIRYESGVTRVKYPPRIGKTLWCLFGKFSSGKDTKRITPQIQNMPLNWKAKMLRTWFNDDGSVPNYKVISIKQKLKPLIIFIQETLSRLDIKSIIGKDEGRWHLRICGYKNLIRFKEKIGFSKGYRKSRKLGEIIEKIKNPRSITKDKILDLLKESPKTRKELQKILDVESGTIYGHLHGWKRKSRTKKTTVGLVDLGLVNLKKKGRINVYTIKG